MQHEKGPRGGKAETGLRKDCKAKNGKRNLREGVSHGARAKDFTVFVYILDILQISMWT